MSGEFSLEPGELRSGLWCEDCEAASGVETQFVHLTSEGAEVIATLRQCAVCHGYRVTDKKES